jgi:hypothetical protein
MVVDAHEKLNITLSALEQNKSLCDANYFIERVQAIEFLELHLFEIEDRSDLQELYQRIETLKQSLESTNESLFADLLESIRAKNFSILKGYLAKLRSQLYTPTDEFTVGYDEIDTLIWGLLDVDLAPEALKTLDPDMVYYQPSSTKTILRLIDELSVSADDVFYDLGSGLGHVPILVNMIGGIKAKGVEIQPFYCRYSTACLNKLGLSGIEFTNADARDANYDDGTIFYLYTPFRGKVLQHVLGKLKVQSKQRPIRVCTFGPCTAEVAQADWLVPTYHVGKIENALATFYSH